MIRYKRERVGIAIRKTAPIVNGRQKRSPAGLMRDFRATTRRR